VCAPTLTNASPVVASSSIAHRIARHRRACAPGTFPRRVLTARSSFAREATPRRAGLEDAIDHATRLEMYVNLPHVMIETVTGCRRPNASGRSAATACSRCSIVPMAASSAGMKYWPQFDETELGWVFRRDAWGHGYATEAARACRDWGFCSLSVPYLTAMIQAANDRSAAVARRLGLSPLRTDVLLGTKVVVYALSRDDWAPAGLDEH
jgi:RimJ/RimL family protein N-acetyltransferase